MLQALMMPLLGKLASNGLGTVAEVVQLKGKKYVEDKLGVKLPEDPSYQDLQVIRLAAMDHEQALTKIIEEELTKRHQADMTSDSWLSKNIRPIALIYLMVLFTLAFIVNVPEQVLDMLQNLLMVVFVFYFGARSGEKIAKILKG